MIQALITFVVLFVFVRWVWKVWGKNYSKELSGDDDEQRDSLLRKIEALKKHAKELKEDDDELKVSKMLEVILKQQKEKEAELQVLNDKIIKMK
jgi:hypothetical protein